MRNFDKQTFKSYVMKQNLTYTMLLSCVFSLGFFALSAQNSTTANNNLSVSTKMNNRVKEYLELQKQNLELQIKQKAHSVQSSHLLLVLIF